MERTSDSIRPHHRAAAGMWGLGGRAYDDISFGISDAITHGAQRLAARPGEQALDVATGTGWTARTVARSGAYVTGVDISAELLAAAEDLSVHVSPAIAFRQADAESLPFETGRFDRVISTFGAMFAADHAQTAAELARVCRPGGRLVMVNWVPGGSVADFFALLGRHSDAPPPEASPLDWGDPAIAADLLGNAFDLTFERGINHAYYDGLDAIREWYERGFGPVRAVLEASDAAGRDAFRADIDAYHRPYLTEAGLLHVKREYLVAIGTRRA